MLHRSAADLRNNAMADRPHDILICSCEDTMPLDVESVRRGCRGAQVTTARQLCRAELARFRAAASAGDRLWVGCTQDAPQFTQPPGGVRRADIRYVNIR